MDYKIEAKPMFWRLSMATGCYSDVSWDYLVVAANSPEEAWEFALAYWKDNFDKLPEEKKIHIYEDTKCRFKWRERKVAFDPEGQGLSFDWTSSFDGIWGVEIEMLKVLHVNSL